MCLLLSMWSSHRAQTLDLSVDWYEGQKIWSTTVLLNGIRNWTLVQQLRSRQRVILSSVYRLKWQRLTDEGVFCLSLQSSSATTFHARLGCRWIFFIFSTLSVGILARWFVDLSNVICFHCRWVFGFVSYDHNDRHSVRFCFTTSLNIHILWNLVKSNLSHFWSSFATVAKLQPKNISSV